MNESANDWWIKNANNTMKCITKFHLHKLEIGRASTHITFQGIKIVDCVEDGKR